MDAERVLIEHPYILVLVAIAVGLAGGAGVYAVRRLRGREHREDSEPGDRPFAGGHDGAGHGRPPSGGPAPDPSTRAGALGKAAAAIGLLTGTLGCDVASVALAAVASGRLADMRANAAGDVERRLVDDCMRDFEGLPPDNEAYLEQHRSCIDRLEALGHLRWLPNIRLVVDDGVCEPEKLCVPGDPAQCADVGDSSDLDFRPGEVTQCYRLIEQSKAERDPALRTDLFASVERRCTKRGLWSGYQRRVQLEYCMWKHASTGICMNSLRTNCPRDGSCCPAAQNAIGAGAAGRRVRPDRYECQKSPLVGLFCQHVDYRTPGNRSESDLCSDTTCDSFGWCRDLADVPGDCLGESCQAYRRSLELALALAAFGACGLVADALGVLLLFRCPAKPKAHAVTSAVAVCAKVVAYLLCGAGGLHEFTSAVVANACFNSEGNARARGADQAVGGSCTSALASAFGSLLLWCVSLRWGRQLVSLSTKTGRFQSP